MAEFYTFDWRSSEEIDSDTEQRLYSQLHHAPNPMFVDAPKDLPIDERNPKSQVLDDKVQSLCCNYNPILKMSAGADSKCFIRKNVVKRTASPEEQADSKYGVRKRKKKSRLSAREEKLMIIDEINEPFNNYSVAPENRRKLSSESSDDVVFLKELETDISINMNLSGGSRQEEEEVSERGEFNVTVLQHSMSGSKVPLVEL